MWPRRSPPIRSASPACSRSTCWRRTPSRRCSYWIGTRLHRHAPVHHRQHHAGAGDLVRRSALVSGLGVCRRGRHSGLHADDAAGLSAAARPARAVPEGARSFSTIWRGRSWSMARPLRRIATSSILRSYPNVFLKLTPLNVSPADWGKATPETFFRHADRRPIGADRIAWGSNFPATDDTLAGHPRQGAGGARASPAPTSATGFSADRAAALSRP